MQSTDKWFTVKILTHYRGEIEEHVGIGKFASTSSFIDSAVSEKLDRLKEISRN